ncbi:hypothetical protein [Micromonospora sp. NPDC050200]|uniref:hypothetical protein n=1 Tax=Micromonospora sp. NPDC050200 TaxID=3155664 RepID=UPI00340B9112
MTSQVACVPQIVEPHPADCSGRHARDRFSLGGELGSPFDARPVRPDGAVSVRACVDDLAEQTGADQRG